jgi:hypothetical protein
MSESVQIRREIALLESQVKECLERITVLQQTLRSEPPERITAAFEAAHPTPASGTAPEKPAAPADESACEGGWYEPFGARFRHESPPSAAGRYEFVDSAHVRGSRP